jgi:uncharacterized damage-inducible protein DinB
MTTLNQRQVQEVLFRLHDEAQANDSKVQAEEQALPPKLAGWSDGRTQHRTHFNGRADRHIRVDTVRCTSLHVFELRISAFEESPMKVILTGLLAVSFLVGMAAAASSPTENDFKALFAKHWQIRKEFTLAVAEAMPAESYGFKPNPEEMSFSELMIHIATSNSEAFANVAGTEALAQPPGTDKKTAIRFLTNSFDRCAKDFAAMTPAQLNKVFDIGEGRQATGIEVLSWAFTDTAHHRGQAEVYLRVKNIKPPKYVF